ncbi:Fluoride ion transporter CrcB [hydrothermal vent metagenome]|uniref:Fluoride ion transporter CrcB n=1 Tax=hydrothermal vent metagenome TaxID=652676 RepID=A0A3B1AMJ2_9ZZZZ
MQVLAIAAGGALGAVLRFWMSNGVYALLGRGFPYGTLAVNVLGSLLMGFLFVLLIDKLSLGPNWRAALLIGLLGAFTTFSAFSMETLNLIEEGETMKALLNMLLSVLLCVGAAWVGVLAGRSI